MSELKIKKSSNWEVLETGERTKLRMTTRTYTINAEMRIVSFSGDAFNMKESLRERLQEDGIVDTLNVSFIHRNLKWYSSSFVCTKSESKYKYFYYTFFDQQCVMICLSTSSERAVLRFREEVLQLLDAINYDNLRVDNIFFMEGKEYFVKTPLSYKFSFTSTREHLLFLGKGGYIVVNVDAPEDLTKMVDDNVYLAGLCIDGCKVRCAGRSPEGNIVSYQILWEYLEEEKIVGVCTYVRSKLSDGASVVSFIYQGGEAVGDEVGDLFCFRVGGE